MICEMPSLLMGVSYKFLVTDFRARSQVPHPFGITTFSTFI